MDEIAARTVTVWDLPTRLFHWTLAVLILFMGVSGKLGLLGPHMAAGPAILALVLFRVIWGLVGSRTSRFSDFVKGPGAIRAYLKAARRGQSHAIGHNPLGGLSVLALLGLVGSLAVCGLFASDDIMAEGPLAHLVSSGMVKTMSGLHRLGFKLLLALVALHVAAALFHTFVKKDNLIRPMVVGRKPVPAEFQGITPVSPVRAMMVLALCAALVWGGLALAPPPPSMF
jgi:cytochrome b